MDSYDLFGEDGGGMLDGLADLGSDNYDPTRSEGQGSGTTQSQAQQQPQQQYYPPQQSELHQESPLQKLASFGGDYAANHLETGAAGSALYTGYGGGGEAPRPAPHYQQQRHMRSQYYQDASLYGMEQQQGWDYPGMARHYQQPAAYQPRQAMYPDKMQYQQQYTQQQYSQQRAAAAAQQQQQQQQQQHYQQMYGSTAGYPGYMQHQQPQAQPQQQQPRIQHHLQQQQQQQQQQQYQQLEYQQHYQQQQQQQQQPQPTPSQPQQAPSAQQPQPPQRGPIGVEVASPQYKQSSPQYRPPFPQLSPQMSPRQMSPRPQLSSPRPVVSPAKAQSPRHKPSSGGYPPQTTLQQLEQMVMPGQEYQGYRSQWPGARPPQHNGPPQEHPYMDPSEPGKQSDLRVPTPHGPEQQPHPDFPHRDKFSSPSQPAIGETPSNKPAIDTGQTIGYSDPFQNGSKIDDMMNHSEKSGPTGLGDLQSLGEASPSQYGASYPGPDVQQMMQQQPPGFPESGPHQQPPAHQPPPSQQPVYQSPISHQQEMAALQQQLQEAYCMPPAPDTQVRIQHLQERISLLQHHEANDQCTGGQHCLLQSPMWSNSTDTVAPTGRGRRGRGRGAGPGRPRKPRKKAGEIIEGPGPMMGGMHPGMPGPPPGMGMGPMGPTPPHLQPMMSNMMAGYMNSQQMVPQPPPPQMMMPPQQQMAMPPQMEINQGPPQLMQQPMPMQHPIGSSSVPQPVAEIGPPPAPQIEPPQQPPPAQMPPMMQHHPPPPPPQIEPPSIPEVSAVVSNSPPPALAPVASPSQEDPPSLDAEEEEEEQNAADNEPAMPLLVAEAPVSTPPVPTPSPPPVDILEEESEPPPEPMQLQEEELISSPSPAPSPIIPPPVDDEEPPDSAATETTPPDDQPPSPPSQPPPVSDEEDEEEDLQTQASSTNVFNFTDDEEAPLPPLHSETEKKKRKREPKKPKEAKPPKPPKPPKEPKAARPPKTPKTPKERKKKEPKQSSESPDDISPKKRGPKKKRKEKEVSEDPKEKSEDEMPPREEEFPKFRDDSIEDDRDLEESRGTDTLEEDVLTPKKLKKARDRSSRAKSKKARKPKKTKGNASEGEGPQSPLDDDTNKRRSARNTQRKKYVDDIMLSISDEENSKLSSPKADSKPSPESTTPIDPSAKPNFVYVNTTDEDSMVVQTILAARKATREVKIEDLEEKEKENGENEEIKDEEGMKKETSFENAEEKIKREAIPGTSGQPGETKTIEVEEYYVKYRNFSYLHCEWKSEEELYKGDKRIAAKIKRFRQKQAHQTNIFENLEEDPFNPDYVEVERVLDVSELADPNTGTTVKHYLVKWRALQYEDSTWELQDDVDPAKIEQFNRFSKLPSKEDMKCKKKPTGKEWEKLEESPVYKNVNTLRDYQLEGLNWLLFSWYNGRNCILADEMGLGKTIQSLTFIHAVHEYGIRGPFLVIAPLSTIPNWQREFEAWTDLNVVVYHGSAASRNMLQEYELYFRNEKGVMMRDVPKFNVLITTFEIIITDINDLRDFNWRICVIDEAHRLKNRNCKLLEGLRLLNLEHRVLLSGTPLQNNVNELFSLLNFLEPQQFSSIDAFMNEFGGLKSETEVQKLQLILKPMMLRRLKEDVEKTLAPKEETVVEVELTNIQKKYYRGILERNFSFLSKGTTSANVPNLMNTMMELRKCCIHPYLLNGAEDQIQHDYKQAHGEDPDAYYKALIQSSGKMVLIDKLLPKLKDNGHRVLIFSQMVRCLDILEDYLVFRKYPFERIDGRIRGNLRQAAIDRFCKPDSDRFVFLLCTKAGGLGINLTAADTVIIYDSDWNPQNDLQAQARCHRIGQQKMVKVYRLLCRNTYEREMFDKASLKLGLDKAILQSMNTSQGNKDPNTNNKQLSKKEIEDLLKKGAYGAIMDEDNAADKFCEEDIDQILERRTQVITLESEKGSTFSKASFTSSGIRHDIDIDDPDFWKKWAKKADIDTSERDEQSELLLHEPRRRTQIKRYGHDENVMDISDLESSSGGPDSDNENDLSSRGRRVKNKLKRSKFRLEEYQTGGGKEGDPGYGTWARSECFKVERGLLTFGWGRWQEILAQNQFREGWREADIEECARVIILYCLRFYRGDDKIRTFIWELITPPENGQADLIAKNHAGMAGMAMSNMGNNIPRGRKAVSRRAKARGLDGSLAMAADDYSDHWSRQDRYDGDIFLEANYRKHLSRHANKLLLRVRMLYYIKHEIIGDLVQNISEGTHVSALALASPHCDQSTSPAPWWDRDADKSLVVGTYKHGYEGYNRMRADPSLSFLALCGPPSQENNDEMRLSDEDDGESEKASCSSVTSAGGPMDHDPSRPQWPSMSDLNHRLRRVINSYQRNFKKEELKLAQKAKAVLTAGLGGMAGDSSHGLHHTPSPADITALMASQGWDWHQLAIYLWKLERREKYEQMARERERQKLEVNQRKWSKREEQDFFRTVSSYGVNYNRQKKKYEWGKFKVLARLEKKFDDTMTEYFLAFSGMCKRVCGIKPSPEEESIDLPVEVISEDRARRVLERIALLSKIREEILISPVLDERLALCRPSADTPDWWIPGKHDKDLLIGVAKHGLGRTDFYILNDPELSFYAITQKHVVRPSEAPVKVESADDLLNLHQNEILVKLEKGEGTLKIEKVALKSEDGKVKEETGEVIDKDNDLASEEVKKEKDEVVLDDSELDRPMDESQDDAKAEVKDSTEMMEVDNVSIRSKEEHKTDEKPTDPPETETKDNLPSPDEDVLSVSKELPEDKADNGELSVPTPSSVGVDERIKTDENKSDVDPANLREDVSKDKSEEALNEDDKTENKSESKATDVEGIEKFKALFPELEVMQKLPEIDTTVVTEGTSKQGSSSVGTATITATPVVAHKPTAIDSTVAQIIAHSYQNHIKWPKEHALQVRLEHIVHAVERGEWPVGTNFSAYNETGTSTAELAAVGQLSQHLQALAAAAAGGVDRASPGGAEVITITTADHRGHSSPSASIAAASKRKRHIAIDVETERAKLHALLNTTSLQHQVKSPWDTHHSNDESLSEDSRRSTPGLQPPPAHQQQSTAARVLSLPFDLSLGKPATAPAAPASPAGGVLDLSSSRPAPPAHSTPVIAPPPTDLAPQDFSIKKHPSSPAPAHAASTPASLASTKSKLDDTLSKLMQRKNCPVEEPVVGKEKKRRKLDEIVLGLSAAKEQMKTGATAGGSNDKPASREVSPSVTVTVSQGKAGSRGSAASSPSPKDTPLSAYLDQHNHLLRQHSLHQQILQQQALKQPSAAHHRSSQPQPSQSQSLPQSSSAKTYDQMIADITKMSSFSNDAKVNKWLAEQSVGAGLGGASLLGGEPAGLSTADFLARRRRPRVDPSLLDWKKLTGEENVSVIHKITGKKLTGPKAPQLKRLAQWLLENPMYDVDPKWAELVKERGNLPADLAKRVQPGSSSGLSSSSAAAAAASSAAAAAAMAAALQQPSSTAAAAAVAAAAAAGKKSSLMNNPPNTSTSGSTSSQQSNMQFPSLAGINPALLSLGGFDPKTNPLLFPFGGMSGALGSLSNMNLTNSLFANLASLGLPNLPGMDSSQDPSKAAKPSASRTKPDQQKSSSQNLQSQLPFFFPNPNLLYSPLGLSGLNPFSLQAGGAYDSLGLLNGGLGNSQLSRSSKGNQPTSSSSSRSSSTQPTTQSSSSRSRQQFTLPQDTQLLESLSRAAASAKSKSQPSKSDVDSLRSLMAAAASSGSLKDKEALEALSRTSADLLFSRLPQPPAAEQPLKKHTVHEELKRKSESTNDDPALTMAKKLRPELTVERRDDQPLIGDQSLAQSLASTAAPPPPDEKREELAPSLPPSTTIAPIPPSPAVSVEPEVENLPAEPTPIIKEPPLPPEVVEPIVVPVPTPVVASPPAPCEAPVLEPPPTEAPPCPPKEAPPREEPAPKPPKKGGKGKRKVSPLAAESITDIIEKKNLRSSAGRAAAAAAARQRAASLESADPPA